MSRRTTQDRFPETLEAACDDPQNCPLDPVAKLAVSDDPQKYNWALPFARPLGNFKRLLSRND